MRHIENYYRHLERLKRETKNERGLSFAFLQLLQNYADEVGAVVVAEESLENGLRPDGTVKNSLHLPIGYWEAKDPKDDLSKEIQKKLKKGYPTKNIIFENTEEIVLFQNGKVVFDIKLSEKEKLHQLLETFFNFEPPEIENFQKALGKFAEDVPSILKVIRKKIDNEKSEQFLKTFSEFHNLCKIHISEKIEKSDIVEMLVQHILTKDIFMKIFYDVDFHQENAISKTMNKLETALLGRKGRQNLLKPIEYYYSAIRRVFQNIDQLEKKQQFLIRVYEEFYKAYNPKGADKLGIVYTPLEIVTFMVHSVDKLLYKYFGKTLASENVNILDPATGTGTFMSEIINFLPKRDLERKFNSELFANEIAILPYYIANLNIEYSYFKKTGEYLKFENIVFGDTLKMYQNEIQKRTTKQMSFFDDEDFKENSERIEKENRTDFTVIIGNPPYNANQQNENDNNKNEVYPILDKRIKATYVKNSSAQKTKVYDMYSRFYRWATDRIEKSGIVAFVTNSSFIDSKTFDGFRKTVFEEFTEIYVLDLGGNVRK
ncbi:MAG TPA: helicase, partial [Campylobacterales bacterium]|nr:helicase [Campylobacterales bacterium]